MNTAQSGSQLKQVTYMHRSAQKISYVLHAHMILWDSDRFAYAEQHVDGSKASSQYKNVVAPHLV
jgi:hypothetical protein